MELIPVRSALLSVSDKAGLLPFAEQLSTLGVNLISTGGTSKMLADAGLPVRPIDDLTGFPEMLDGRVKTLHPFVHGGILADRDKPEHMATIASHGIAPIDLVVVNLYPFAATIAKEGCTIEDAIENIDIGGPAMVRSTAKNHHGVAIVVSPTDYARVIDELTTLGGISLTLRKELAAKAYAHTAAYDAMIASYLETQYATDDAPTELPATLRITATREQVLRYGENPHQKAAFYTVRNTTGEPCIGRATRLDASGKEVSFNNLYDLDGALELVKEFPEAPTAAIIKHANPCGCAQGVTLADAFDRARAADTISAFGGILAVNRVLDLATAQRITGPNTFFECIVAPGYDADARELLLTKKKWGANLRLLEVGSLDRGPGKTGLVIKQIIGGLLVGTRDYASLDPRDFVIPTRRTPSSEELKELMFAWRVVKHVKSNAIVMAKDGALRGVGAGQMNRVRSVRLAIEQAAEHANGCVLASDAFFPFPDGPETAAKAGITAIIQPGGSVKDDEVVAVCDDYNIAMVFTGVRHFRH